MTPSARITQFVLERLDDLPVSEKITMYGDLAEFAPTPEIASEFRSLAVTMINAERKQRQLLLNFRQRTGGQS